MTRSGALPERSLALDAFSGSSGTAAVVGVGCKANNGSAVATLTSSGGAIGGTLTWTGNSNIAAVDPAFLTLGSSSTLWGAVPLPFDLSIFGATGCWVNNDILATVSSTTTATGSCAIPLAVPANPALGGAVLFSQMAFLDAGANAFGLITTPGRKLTLPVYVGASRI